MIISIIFNCHRSIILRIDYMTVYYVLYNHRIDQSRRKE
jgi:hypothetical protein